MKLNILQVSTRDLGGGAERVALNLHQGYQVQGHRAWLAVGQQKSDLPNILPLDHTQDRNWGYQQVEKLRLKRGLWRLHRPLGGLAEPQRSLARWQGYEDFEFPATKSLLDLPPQTPDILHGHNLHGGYFDLRELAQLSQKIPTFLTLHDEWLLTGHCAYSLTCERWRTGCGSCPDLTLYPAIPHDKTAENWARKQEIYAKSRLYIITPSQWLMDEVEQSILAGGTVGKKVIPNGIDLKVFHPAERSKIRAELGLPQTAYIPLFSWAGSGTNPYKDYETIQNAFKELAQGSTPILGLRLGSDAPPEKLSESVEIWSVPFTNNPTQLAKYYQAADVYLHATKADNLPNAISEAMACGLPVIATQIGGIPEQVTSETGILLEPNNWHQMAQAILSRPQMGEKAAEIAHQKFKLQTQIQTHLDWYAEVLHEFTPAK